MGKKTNSKTKTKKVFKKSKSKSKSKSNPNPNPNPNSNPKSKSKKVFKKLMCSPSQKTNYSCYSNDSLENLKRSWNSRHPDSKINTNNSREIWDALKNNMQNVCNTEKCWLNKIIPDNLNQELKNYTFAPDAPNTWRKNPNEWLSSVDINKVMKQYEHEYPSFVFIGPSPIDFDNKKLFSQCVWNELCNFNLEDLIKKGKNKIGIVFNTDPHYLEGSHWVCVFIDINKQFIYYFDSNADETPEEINKLTKRIISQGNALKINFKYSENVTEHQKLDTECGMYVLYTISQLLENKKSPQMFKKRVPDKEMEKLRTVLFN